MELHEFEPKTDSERILDLYKTTQYVLVEIRSLRADMIRIPLRCEAENERIRRIEIWQGRITGGLVIVGIVASASLAWMGKLFGLP